MGEVGFHCSETTGTRPDISEQAVTDWKGFLRGEGAVLIIECGTVGCRRSQRIVNTTSYWFLNVTDELEQAILHGKTSHHEGK